MERLGWVLLSYGQGDSVSRADILEGYYLPVFEQGHLKRLRVSVLINSLSFDLLELLHQWLQLSVHLLSVHLLKRNLKLRPFK